MNNVVDFQKKKREYEIKKVDGSTLDVEQQKKKIQECIERLNKLLWKIGRNS